MHDKCMAVKTITIDLDAYELLRRRKKPGQSFSQVIKEHFGPSKTGRDLLRALGGIRVSEETLAEMDHVVRLRQLKRNRVRVINL